MSHSLRLLFALVLLLLTREGLALGLGELQVDSHLNQPFAATIGLRGDGGFDPARAQAAIAPLEVYERLGLSAHERPFNIEVSIDSDSSEPVIRLSSRKPIREPVLDLVIDLQWPGGHLLRDYAVLLDPPPAVDRAATLSVPEPSAAMAAEVKAEPLAPLKRAARPWPLLYGPVQSGESLGSIAEKLTEGTDINATRMMLALFHQNPHAFVRGNMNAIKLGVRLRVPAYAAVAAMDAEGARRRVYQKYQQPTASVSGEPGKLRQADEPIVAAPAEVSSTVTAEAEPVSPAATAPVAKPRLAIVGLDSERVMAMSASELQEQLQRVEQNNVRAREENAALQRRLQELEQQLTDLGERLLALPVEREAEDKPAVTLTTPELPAEPLPASEPAKPVILPAPVQVQSAEDGGWANWILLLAALLALLLLAGAIWYVWQQRRWDYYKEI